VLLLVKTILAMSILWAAAALTVQVLAARGRGRRDFSRPTGSPRRGVAYIFTTAMLPGHKESIRLHPIEFVVGLAMHTGVVCSLLAVALLLFGNDAGPRFAAWFRPLTAIALAAGAGLLIRRAVSPSLRAFSVPDDYLAVLATGGLLSLITFLQLDARGQLILMLYSAVLFVYLPLGKLRHVVFFFVARGDYGRRLGYRGVYPPAATGTE
jgi:hypothetical protein